MVFYRVSRKIDENNGKLPFFKGTKLFKMTGRKGFEIKVNGDLSCKVSQLAIDAHREQYEKVVNSIKDFTRDLDDELVDCINAYLEANNINLIDDPNYVILGNYSYFNFIVGNLNLNDKKIKDVDMEKLQLRADAFMILNKNIMQVLPINELNLSVYKDIDFENLNSDCKLLSHLFFECKKFIFSQLKNGYLERLTSSLPASTGEIQVTLNRVWTRYHMDKGRVDNEGEWTTFGI
jgi:hypothetical protein